MTIEQLATPMAARAGGSGMAVTLGVLSAACFAASNALQHRAAGTVPGTTSKPLAVLAHLARQRTWVLATGISFCAMLLHASALRQGSIALVQPLMLLGVVAAVLMRSALERTAPRWCELRAVGLTTAGLAAFILTAMTRSRGAEPRLAGVATAVVGCFALGLGALRASRSRLARTPARRAAILGCGAGVMFGATAGVLKIVGTWVTGAAGPVALVVALVALVAAGLLGTAMNQRAYQIAPISFSMPLVNVVDILVAVVFGALVLGELPGHSPLLLVLQLVALGCVGLGLRLVSGLEPGQSAPHHRARPSANVALGEGSGAPAEPVGRLSDVNVRGAIVGAGAAPGPARGRSLRRTAGRPARRPVRCGEVLARAGVPQRGDLGLGADSVG
jgi:drug/metabolite transporter (DMT)-like permease